METLSLIINILLITNLVIITAVPNMYYSGVKFLRPIIVNGKLFGIFAFILSFIHIILGLIKTNFGFKEELISGIVIFLCFLTTLILSNKSIQKSFNQYKVLITKLVYFALGGLIIHIVFVSTMPIYVILGLLLIVVSLIILCIKNREKGLLKLKCLLFGLLINYIIFFSLINFFSLY